MPLLAALVLTLAAAPAGALVRYSFDDDRVATGPDTFAVFEKAKGRVHLSTAFRYSGYRSVEIRDVADDGNFQGALRLWQESTEGGPPHTSLMLKLSDVFHLLGDLQKEREYREAIYGSLHEEREHPRESPRPPPPGGPDAQEEPDADLD